MGNFAENLNLGNRFRPPRDSLENLEISLFRLYLLISHQVKIGYYIESLNIPLIYRVVANGVEFGTKLILQGFFFLFFFFLSMI